MESDWKLDDYVGAFLCRISAYRMRYSVEPGLYAIGQPDAESDVFVTANYKLSFNILRKALKGFNSWILVLDTKGINAWCAAGKGTFGTDELIREINNVRIHKLVNHRRIIIPQLGAVGVNANSVQHQTGFRVYFGPVCAKDIPEYVKAGYKKSDKMRLIRFSLLNRLVLTPMEIIPAFKKFLLFALIVLLFFGLQPSGILFEDALKGGMPFLLLGLISIISGAFITPVLLPFIPFRSFAVKGLITGMIFTFATMNTLRLDILPTISSYIFFPLASSYIALQFTGSTTLTSMSGVKKELKIGLPIYLVFTVISFILLLVHKIYLWKAL
ncbi:MAG: mercury methylation corrinoid protein HgcA [Thermodesulfovibrionales bacterium]|nr:mercury methylation corrinoid protein HgcA [Thermodesulfovibrionales bacterium]